MHQSLLVLAGGMSSRMKRSSAALSKAMEAQANTRSKGLIEVNGRPMLDYLLFNAYIAGYRNIYIITGVNDMLFKSYYGVLRQGNPYQGLHISYAAQHIPEGREKPLGTADAVFQALEQYPELQQQMFTVCNCDNLYSVAAFSALRETVYPNAFISYDRDALLFSEARIARFALVKTDDQHFLQDIIEKPSAEAMSAYQDADGKFRVSMNIFKFDGSLFFPFLQHCPMHPERQEKELPTALLHMAQAHPGTTAGIPFAEHVPDLTAKDDIAVMNDYLDHHFSDFNWS